MTDEKKDQVVTFWLCVGTVIIGSIYFVAIPQLPEGCNPLGFWIVCVLFLGTSTMLALLLGGAVIYGVGWMIGTTFQGPCDRFAQTRKIWRQRRRQEQALARERQQKVKESRTLQAAREEPGAEATRFYKTHQSLLRDCYPETRFRAELRSRIPESMSVEEAWTAARELIKELQQLVSRALQRQAKRALSLKLLDNQIAACRAKIACIEKSAKDATFLENEKQGQLLKILKLEAEKELLLTPGEGEEP